MRTLYPKWEQGPFCIAVISMLIAVPSTIEISLYVFENSQPLHKGNKAIPSAAHLVSPFSYLHIIVRILTLFTPSNLNIL